MKKKETLICVIAIVLLLLGTGIYFYFRSPVKAFMVLHIAQKESLGFNTNYPLQYFAIYCLPDALWYMSLLIFQTFFFQEKGTVNRFLVGISICLPFILEMFQYFGIMSGTFDWYDILTYCITLILYLICLKNTSLLSLSK